jgi:hypothetical protein
MVGNEVVLEYMGSGVYIYPQKPVTTPRGYATTAGMSNEV